MPSTGYFLLDAHHVSEIDGSGAKTLQQLHHLLQAEGKHLAVSHLDRNSPFWGFLGVMGDIEILGEDHFFVDTDHALEWAEDDLLAKGAPLVKSPGCEPFERFHVARHLTGQEQRELRSHLRALSFNAGAQLMGEGDCERKLIILTEGRLSVHVWNSSESRFARLMTIGPGFVVGEQAFLEGLPHSHSVLADTDGQALTLSLEAFETLSRAHPTLTMKLLFNVGRELSARVRRVGAAAASLDH